MSRNQVSSSRPLAPELVPSELVLSGVIYGEQPALCEGKTQAADSPSRFKPLPLLLLHTFHQPGAPWRGHFFLPEAETVILLDLQASGAGGSSASC